MTTVGEGFVSVDITIFDRLRQTSHFFVRCIFAKGFFTTRKKGLDKGKIHKNFLPEGRVFRKAGKTGEIFEKFLKKGLIL